MWRKQVGAFFLLLLYTHLCTLFPPQLDGCAQKAQRVCNGPVWKPALVAEVAQVVLVAVNLLLKSAVVDFGNGAVLIARKRELSQSRCEVAQVLVNHIHAMRAMGSAPYDFWGIELACKDGGEAFRAVVLLDIDERSG